MDKLSALQAFVAVAERGSFTAAARRLGVSLAVLSRQIASLEGDLGVRLLARTTRHVAVTDGGRDYLARAKGILDALAEADAAAAQHQHQLRGRLSVTAPVLFSRHYAAAAVAAFLVNHPAMQIDFEVSDRYADLVQEGIDVAIRIGRLADSSLVARRLGVFRRVVVAAPGYLAKRGLPRRPEELGHHDSIAFSMLQEPEHWSFSRGTRQISVHVPVRFRSNNAEAGLHAAEAGLGLLLAPPWQVREAIRGRRLLPVLADWQTPETPINAVHPHGRLPAAKSRALVDFLDRRWRREDFSALPARAGKAS